jgi:hypothetical protein
MIATLNGEEELEERERGGITACGVGGREFKEREGLLLA